VFGVKKLKLAQRSTMQAPAAPSAQSILGTRKTKLKETQKNFGMGETDNV
jgi:hypothetical protein